MNYDIYHYRYNNQIHNSSRSKCVLNIDPKCPTYKGTDIFDILIGSWGGGWLWSYKVCPKETMVFNISPS